MVLYIILNMSTFREHVAYTVKYDIKCLCNNGEHIISSQDLVYQFHQHQKPADIDLHCFLLSRILKNLWAQCAH